VGKVLFMYINKLCQHDKVNKTKKTIDIIEYV